MNFRWYLQKFDYITDQPTWWTGQLHVFIYERSFVIIIINLFCCLFSLQMNRDSFKFSIESSKDEIHSCKRKKRYGYTDRQNVKNYNLLDWQNEVRIQTIGDVMKVLMNFFYREWRKKNRWRSEKQVGKEEKRNKNWTVHNHLSIVFDAHSARHFSANHCSIQLNQLNVLFYRDVSIFSICLFVYSQLAKNIIVLFVCQAFYPIKSWLLFYQIAITCGANTGSYDFMMLKRKKTIIIAIEIVFFCSCLLCFSFWLQVLSIFTSCFQFQS